MEQRSCKWHHPFLDYLGSHTATIHTGNQRRFSLDTVFCDPPNPWIFIIHNIHLVHAYAWRKNQLFTGITMGGVLPRNPCSIMGQLCIGCKQVHHPWRNHIMGNCWCSSLGGVHLPAGADRELITSLRSEECAHPTCTPPLQHAQVAFHQAQGSHTIRYHHSCVA